MRRFVLVVLSLFSLTAAVGCRTKNKTPEQEISQPALPGTADFIRQPSGMEYDSLIGDWIFGAIDDAWTALEDKRAGYSLKSKTITINPPSRRRRTARKPRIRTVKKLEYNVLLAVMNLRASERKLEFVLVDQNGKTNGQGFKVDKGLPSGVGTSYQVITPAGYVVLAIKRVLSIQGKYQEVIYTPYTAALDVPLIRQAGYDYLVARITEAQADLRKRGVRSRVFGDRLVADLVPLRVSLALSIIEHVDPFIFERDARRLGEDRSMKALANRALVVVGANREWSYGYSVSPAGARGQFQFIPGTYNAICQLYPKAGLDRSFVKGMNDHTNGAKASLLLFDSDWSYVPNGHRTFFAQHTEALGMYLAAAYNGGAARASRAIQDFGDKWTEHVLPETRVYIRKFLVLSAALNKK
jgi:hypothetical protein